MDLVHVWYDDTYWSKISEGTIPIPVHDLEVKVTDFEFLCQRFLETHYLQTFWQIWFMFDMIIDISPKF